MGRPGWNLKRRTFILIDVSRDKQRIIRRSMRKAEVNSVIQTKFEHPFE